MTESWMIYHLAKKVEQCPIYFQILMTLVIAASMLANRHCLTILCLEAQSHLIEEVQYTN